MFGNWFKVRKVQLKSNPCNISKTNCYALQSRRCMRAHDRIAGLVFATPSFVSKSGWFAIRQKAWGQSLLGLPSVTLKTLGLLLGRLESKPCRFAIHRPDNPKLCLGFWILNDLEAILDVGFRIWILGLLVAILHVFSLIQYWIATFLQFCTNFGR